MGIATPTLSEGKMSVSTAPLNDGVHAHEAGGYIVIIDGRAVMHGALVERFEDRDEAERFYAAATA